MEGLVGNKAVSVPEDWPNIEAFTQWFVDHGYPMMPPEDQQMFSTDSTSSFIVFRHKQYQAELYMFFPGQRVPKHTHPMDQVFIPLAGHMRTYSEIGGGVYRPRHAGKAISPTLPRNSWHGLKTTERGCLMYVLQRYPEGIRPCSASVDYDGEVTGDVQRKQKEKLGRPPETPLAVSTSDVGLPG
jgi:quercetin dioxygenase-like cupin family protein